jgi:hypothetical protein
VNKTFTSSYADFITSGGVPQIITTGHADSA